MGQKQGAVPSTVTSKRTPSVRPGTEACTQLVQLEEANQFRTALAGLYGELIGAEKPKGNRGDRLRQVAAAVGIEVRKHTKFDTIAAQIRTKLEKTGLTETEIDQYLKIVE